MGRTMMACTAGSLTNCAPTRCLLPPPLPAPQFPTVGFEKAEMRYKD